MDNIYNALLAYNEVSGLFQSCTSMLLAKINNPNYAKIEMLMDSIYELQILVAKINIKGEIITHKKSWKNC